MTTASTPTSQPAGPSLTTHLKRRRWLRRIGWTLAVLLVAALIVRIAMPSTIRWYVNRTLDQNPLYDGQIGDVTVHLYRGAYSIENVQLIKTTGNVPVPLFAAKRVDLGVEWGALLHGRLVGRIKINEPELNFVDAEDKSSSQTGIGDDAGGSGDQDMAAAPWLGVIRELFPFKINSATVVQGSVHFRTYNKTDQGAKPVDIYISQLDAQLDNLTNINDEVTPLITTCKATGLAMDQAKFEYEMKLDPFSFKPTFTLVVRLLGLDTTKLNDFTRQYANFDTEHGWFDLVVEIDSKEGALEGYVKPLFRNLRILTWQDVKEDNLVDLFWEAIVGAAGNVLKNQQRDQFGTLIPFTGNVAGPKPDVIATVLNVLRNAFIRAYLPKLQGGQEVQGMEFGPPSVDEPATLAN